MRIEEFRQSGNVNVSNVEISWRLSKNIHSGGSVKCSKSIVEIKIRESAIILFAIGLDFSMFRFDENIYWQMPRTVNANNRSLSTFGYVVVSVPRVVSCLPARCKLNILCGRIYWLMLLLHSPWWLIKTMYCYAASIKSYPRIMTPHEQYSREFSIYGSVHGTYCLLPFLEKTFSLILNQGTCHSRNATIIHSLGQLIRTFLLLHKVFL